MAENKLTTSGAKYWAILQPNGQYKWYAIPRGTGMEPLPANCTVETYSATGRFTIREDGERAEIYELVSSRSSQNSHTQNTP
jgi:hypothetical protein